jgi:hypothetical protein
MVALSLGSGSTAALKLISLVAMELGFLGERVQTGEGFI